MKLLPFIIIISVYSSFQLLLPRKFTVMRRNLIRFAHTAAVATKLPRLNVSRSSAKSQFRFCRTLFAQSTNGLYSLVFRARGDLSTNQRGESQERTGKQLGEKERGGEREERDKERERKREREKVEIRTVSVSNLNLRVHLPYHFQTNITGCASFIGTHGTNAADLSSRRHSLVLVLCH